MVFNQSKPLKKIKLQRLIDINARTIAKHEDLKITGYRSISNATTQEMKGHR